MLHEVLFFKPLVKQYFESYCKKYNKNADFRICYMKFRKCYFTCFCRCLFLNSEGEQWNFILNAVEKYPGEEYPT